MRNINNYVRSYAKGKSFEFTEWSKLNNYTNSGIKQDFVTYDGSLYACICDVAAGNEPPDKDTKHWKLAVIGSYTKREDIIKLLGFEPVNLEGSNDFSKEQTFSGGISLNNTNIKEVADPEDDSDAATKNYVDQQITFRKGTGEGSARLDSSTASGDYSVAEGIQTIAYNPGEHAEGVLNVSKRREDVDDESYTIHSVGIGNDQDGSLDRKNAWEILKTGEAYLYGIGGYDGKNSEAYGSENAPKTVQKELLKIADPFSGVFCMKLGKSGSLTTEEVAAIREKLAYMIDNEKFYLVSIYDDVDKQFRGDCEIIRESSKNSYLIMQITAETTPTFIMTTYTFYADNTYTRNQYTSSLKSYSAGDGIAIDKDRKISCTIDTTLFRVVSSLPETPAKGDENKLHIVKESTIEGELFSEYLWAEGKWERLGSPKSATALQPIQSITYEELVALRDSSSLVAGMQYRITDYICTTTTAGTKSAGHVFDIIVTADSESVLNEDARAIQHEGDEYFANSDLNAWKLWYCLDNDTERFAWADATNGKGVIYRMIDEFNNDVPYDFKNIQFYRKWNAGKSLWSIISSGDNDNIGVPCYTFSSSGDSLTTSFTDFSLDSSSRVYSNTIKYYINNDKQTLNNNCFFGNRSYYNSLGNGCYNNSFGKDCHNNSFGDYCYYNSFRSSCTNNSFGSSCFYNSLGSGCACNSFDSNCCSNSFQDGCCRNAFRNGCYSNSFGQSCNNNSFGNECRNNFFGSYCDSNSFWSGCSSNSFWSSCSSNSFGNNCSSNTLGSSCLNNSFGSSCFSNSFGSDFLDNSFGDGCRHNSFRISPDTSSTLKNYVRYNHFDDGCSYNVIWNSNTTSSTILLKNINVNRGVVGTDSSYNVINIDTLNSEQEINVNQVNGIVSIGNILSITYESLKTLKDNSQLIPGQQYRIIDYITTTSQENTQSVGHQFDIIVTALNECTLSEEAQAIQHSNDEYFSSSNLSAWKLWYCLDNDTNRFLWAGDVKVGEIEHKSYDSSKCTINSELIDGNAFITPFNFQSCVWVDANNDGATYDDGINHDISELVYEWGYFTDENNDTHLCIYKSDADLYAEEGQPDYGDKYLYRGIVNVDGTEYDYWQKWDDTSKDVDVGFNGDHVYATTQRIVSNPEAYSVTIETEDIYGPGKGVIYRMIDEWNNDVPYDFKNIQFKCPVDPSKHPYYYYTFASGDKEANTDYSLNAANKCYSNTIKEYMTGSKRQLNCIILFGSSCHSNTFGINCYSNVFFGSSCFSNTFGIGCYSNFFHDYCYKNTFGNYCHENNFGRYGAHNTLGNSCSNIKFVKRTNTSPIKLCDYYKFNKIDDGVKYVYLSNTIMSGTHQTKQVQNYHIVRGVSGTESNYVTITTSLNLAYETRVAMNSKGEIKKYCEADLIA